MQFNVDFFLQSHREALVRVTGDFNYRGIGLAVKHIQRTSGLSQIIEIATSYNVSWPTSNKVEG